MNATQNTQRFQDDLDPSKWTPRTNRQLAKLTFGDTMTPAEARQWLGDHVGWLEADSTRLQPLMDGAWVANNAPAFIAYATLRNEHAPRHPNDRLCRDGVYRNFKSGAAHAHLDRMAENTRRSRETLARNGEGGEA